MSERPVLLLPTAECLLAAAVLLPAYDATLIATLDYDATKGRDVLIWPEAGDAGRQAAADLSAPLLKVAKRVRVVHADDQPDNWTLGQALTGGWDTKGTVKYAREHLTDVKRVTPAKVPRGTSTPTEPADQSSYVLWEQLDLARNERGPFATEANALRILASHATYSGRIWLDEFSQRLMLDADGGSRLFSRTDAISALIWMQESLRLPKMPLSAVERAASIVGERNKRHPVREYLDGLTWDRVPRLADLLTYGFGATPTPYTQAVGRCWLTAMVARIYQPGCKADNVPVFEGAQGIMKSSALSLLGGPWFLETTENPLKSRKDFLLAMQGKWLIEIPEIDRIGGKHGDLADLTGIITIRVDSYRVPYGVTTMDYPRQSIFAGTANRSQWQTDETGGRRYWPITCGDIDLDWLSDSRDQIFAEAVHLYRAGGSWWDVPKDDARDEQESRRVVDVWEQIIGRYLTESVSRSFDPHEPERWYPRAKPLDYVTILELAETALNIPSRSVGPAEQKRIVKALTVLGFTKQRPRFDGKRQWVYAKPNTFTDLSRGNG